MTSASELSWTLELSENFDASKMGPTIVLSQAFSPLLKHVSPQHLDTVVSNDTTQSPHRGLASTAETSASIESQSETTSSGTSVLRGAPGLASTECKISTNSPSWSSTAASPSSWNSRPPRRQAANKARMDLSAAWSSLDEHETSSDSDSGTDTDTNRPKQLDSEGVVDFGAKAREKRLRHHKSRALTNFDDDSSGDEYREEENGEWLGRGRRRLSFDDNMSKPCRKRMRGVPVGRTRMDPRLKITKDEVQRLIEYLAEKTDWEDAARCVAVGDSRQRQQQHQQRQQNNDLLQDGELRSAKGSELSMTGSARGTRKRKTATADEMSAAVKLSTHWKEILGKKIVGLYKK